VEAQSAQWLLGLQEVELCPDFLQQQKTTRPHGTDNEYRYDQAIKQESVWKEEEIRSGKTTVPDGHQMHSPATFWLRYRLEVLKNGETK